jgi:hypothetical protein
MRTTRARAAIAVCAGIATFGIVGASAATLGITSGGVGAGATAVSGCDTAVDLTYATAYSATTGTYQVTTVSVNNIDGCNGKQVKVTLRDATNTALASGTGVVVGATAASVTVAVAADAAAVVGAAVVIG